MGTHFISEKAFFERDPDDVCRLRNLEPLSAVPPQKQHGGQNRMMTQVLIRGNPQVKLRQSNFLLGGKSVGTNTATSLIRLTTLILLWNLFPIHPCCSATASCED